jgi:hypothetical protein
MLGRIRRTHVSWWKCSAAEELVRSLPYRMQGHLWAVFVDPETGITQDQPEYDPWGDTRKA